MMMKFKEHVEETKSSFKIFNDTLKFKYNAIVTTGDLF